MNLLFETRARVSTLVNSHQLSLLFGQGFKDLCLLWETLRLGVSQVDRVSNFSQAFDLHAKHVVFVKSKCFTFHSSSKIHLAHGSRV